MEISLPRIVNITGKPGLYRVITATKNSFVVESIEEKPKKMVVAATQRIASLNDISIFTVEEYIMLSEVFARMQTKENDLKPQEVGADNYALMEYFEQIVPEYDEDKVHPSDMRKVIKWFVLLRPFIDFVAYQEEQNKNKEANA
jgi:hypothetical protein